MGLYKLLETIILGISYFMDHNRVGVAFKGKICNEVCSEKNFNKFLQNIKMKRDLQY